MVTVDTRLVPYTQAEYVWARSRPREHQTPIPAVGDEVWYRHERWAAPVRAEVLHVQPLDDMTDPMLWTVVPDRRVEGRMVVAAAADPWPLLVLRTAGLGRPQTREARLRGSPGWLPLDWESRFRPVPDFVVVG